VSSLVTADGTVLRRAGRTAGLTGIWGGTDRVRLSGEARSISYEAIYEGNPTCAAVVNKLRHQVATLPLKTYKLDDKGDRVVQRDHPVANLICGRPAPRTPSAKFKEWLIFPTLVHGNALVAKYRDPNGDGTPTALLPLSWPYVSAYAQQGQPVEVWSTTQLGETRYIDVEETIHLAWESGSCHGLGVSPLKQLASTIKLDDALRRYSDASFDNGARPSGAIVLPENARVGKNELALLQSEISRLHGGVDNAMKVALLAGGATGSRFRTPPSRPS
jgi:HK97 family phage portal protein